MADRKQAAELLYTYRPGMGVKAIQYTGANFEDIMDFAWDEFGSEVDQTEGEPGTIRICRSAIPCDMHPGDWLTSAGEVFTWRQFQERFEPVVRLTNPGRETPRTGRLREDLCEKRADLHKPAPESGQTCANPENPADGFPPGMIVRWRCTGDKLRIMGGPVMDSTPLPCGQLAGMSLPVRHLDTGAVILIAAMCLEE